MTGNRSASSERKPRADARRSKVSSPPSEPSRRPAETRGPRPIRLTIATQPTLFRDALSRLLSNENDLEVVGQGWDEDQIAEILNRENPHLLVFDYEALGPNSEGIISRLRRGAPKTRVLVMASRSGEETTERVLRAGASGLVAKQLSLETLVRAIRAVAAGEIWANRRTTALTLAHLTESSAAPTAEGRLTKREQQIVDGVSRGLRNKEIARQLSISEKTVKSHLSNIFMKLGLEGRFALAMLDQRPGQT